MLFQNFPQDVLVCVPTYNSEDSIEITLRSILGQTSTRFGILVADNGSTDQTVSIARRIQGEWGSERFHIHENARNFGRIGNWNRCVELFLEGRYAYLKFVFAGDTLEPRALEVLQSIFDQNKELGLAAAAYEVQYPEKRITKQSFPAPCVLEPPAALREFFLRGNWVGAPLSCMFSRLALSGARFSEELEWAADWKFFMDIASRFRSAYLPLSIGTFSVKWRRHYLSHAGSISSRMEDIKMRQYALFLLGKRLLKGYEKRNH